MSAEPANYVVWLFLFTVLLFLRVIGQLLVAWRAPTWLPPMDQWQSGLLPYPALVLGQAIVLTLMTWICLDFARASGMFVRPYPGRAVFVLWASYLYFGGMVFRYVRRMTNRPDQRWFGGTIPIIFHSIVAAFLFTFGTYHHRLGG